MVKLRMFELKECPHCHLARRLLEDLLNEEQFKDIEMEFIEEQEQAELAAKYDYYYVPTFYVGDKKLAEGHVEEEDVRRVLEQALELA